jgi:hypothetical protein
MKVDIAGCSGCHTRQERGQPLPGMDFSGGVILDGPLGPRGHRKHHAGSLGNFLL